MESPLAGLRVLDFGMAAVGPVSAEYMAMLGADVIKIESPSGDTVRRGKGGPGAWPGSTFLGNNIGKRGIVLNLKDDDDRGIALMLVKTADVLLENFRSPEILERLGLGWDRISTLNPRLIYLQSSAFGGVGPQVGKTSSDPVAQAYGGLTSVTGEPGGAGEFSRGSMSLDWNGAMVNLEAMLIGLYVRNRTGKGMKINTSQFQSTLLTGTTRIAEYLATGVAPGPMGSARPNFVPDQAFATADGYVTATALHDRMWRRLCAAIGRAELADDARFVTAAGRIEHRDALIVLLEQVFRARSSADWVECLRQAGLPVGEFQRGDTLAESLLDNPQVQAEQLVTILPQTGGGDILSQQPHWRFDKTEARIVRPSPGLGEHQEEVMAELRAWKPVTPPPPLGGGDGLALAGLRVVDFSQGISGPICAMQFGDLGADVIKVEPPDGDWMRQIPPFQSGESAVYLQLNRNKRGIAVDLKTPEGIALAKKLVAEADVVVEGYRPGVMKRLGLDYETLSRDNPRLVYCSISGYGSRGPLAEAPATELDIQVAVGATRHLGTPGGTPVRYGFDLASIAAGMAGMQAIMAALVWRDQSGQGQHVETSLLAAEIAVHQCAYVAERNPLDRGSNGYLGPRTGPNFGFRTADGSTLLSARGYDTGWVPMLKALGLADLLADERFASREAVTVHQADLPLLVNPRLSQMRWEDARRIIEEVAEDATFVRMQDIAEVVEDEQTRAVNAMPVLEGHPTVGPLRVVNSPWLFDEQRASLRLPPPLLGQHSMDIAREFGYSDAEIHQLTATGALVSTSGGGRSA